MADPIRLFVLDVDGVMTDGSLLYGEGGELMKSFNSRDGLGLVLLKRLGIELAVVSGKTSAPLLCRLDEIGILHRRLACSDKVTALEDICADLGLALAETAFMGDDLIDRAAMEACGYGMAPADAVAEVCAVADFVSEKPGGHGAVRDACEHLASLMGKSLLDALTASKGNLWQ